MIKALFMSGTAESITRVVFFFLALNIVGWEWWAIVTKTSVPNMLELLGFAATILGVKQFMEGKYGVVSPTKQGP